MIRNGGNLNIMKWILYQTLCLVTKKIYVGYHKTENPTVFDGYLGCGVYIQRPSSYKKRETPFQCAVEKYGPDQFWRSILAIVETEEEVKQLEKIIVNEAFIRRSDTYNIKLGGEGGCPDNWGITVYMYDIEGNFVKEFESAFDCYKSLNPSATNGSAVLKAIRTGQTLHGFQFSKEKLPFMKKWEAKKGSHNFKRKVAKYDENMNLLKVYESTLAAKKDGYQNVAKALKYPERKCKNCFFRYIE